MATSPSWSFQQSTGTYERPCASSETCYGSLLHFFDSTGTYCCGITFRVTGIPPATVISSVREAIGRYRFHAPVIACDRKVSEEQPFRQSLVYKPASNAEEVRSWVEESLTIEANGNNLKEYLSQKTDMRLPYVHSNGQEQYFSCTLALHEEDVYSFIGHVSHGFVDGRPYLNFTRFILDAIASPGEGESLDELAWGTEWKNLPDSPETLARRNVQLTDADWEQGWSELQSKFEQVFSRKELGESLKPPCISPADQGPITRALQQIDETNIDIIKGELRKTGLSMACLIPAAHMLTVFQQNHPLQPHSYVTLDLSMIDTVRFFPPEYSGPLMASSRTAFVPLIVEAKDINWSATIRNQLITIIEILEKQVQYYLRFPQLTLIDSIGPNKPDVAPMHPHTCIISYIGVIERIIPSTVSSKAGDIELQVLDFDVMHRHAGGFQRPSHILWSFQGKLNMLLQGSNHWEVEYFEKVLEETTNNMLKFVSETALDSAAVL